MSTSEVPNEWRNLLEQMLPDLLQIIVDSWPSIYGTLDNDKEDKITEEFCRILRKNRTVRGMPFKVDIQSIELNPAAGQKQGRMDIVFKPESLPQSPDENIYFCLECKRLNYQSGKSKRSGGPEYVKDGMMRFVKKQYSPSVKHGCMVGYVLNGKITNALKSVKKNVQKHHRMLQMDKPGILNPCSLLTTVSTAKETYHNRKDEQSPFCIFHIFLEADKLIP